jgi:spermidine synthase
VTDRPDPATTPATEAPDPAGLTPGRTAPADRTGDADGTDDADWTGDADRAVPAERTAGPTGAGPGGRPGGAALPNGFAATIVFVSAAAVLVLETLALRLIAPYVGVTLQTNTAVIGAALTAIAVGAWAGGRTADLSPDPGRLLGPLLLVGACLTLLTLPVVRYVGEATRGSGDASATLLLAMTAVIVPAGLLSSVAPMVAKLQLRSLAETGTVVGRLSGLGTLGGIVATFATGFVLVAAFRTSTILIGTATVVAVVGGIAVWYDRRRPGPRPGSLPGAAVALLPLSLLLVAVAPNPCQWETEYHCARVVADPDRPTGRTLELDTLRHSYVDLADPEYLKFEYTRAVAAVADSIRPPGQPMTALHIGGGGFTMPRYLAANRPGTRSTVLEIDGGVVRLGRERLGVDRIPDLTVRVGDARTGLQEQPAGRYDLVVGDAFGGLAVPWHLTTREVVEQVRDTLAPAGVYAVNVIDYQPDRFARAEIATLRAVFPHVAFLGAPVTVGGVGGGNHVLVASRQPLPLAAIQRELSLRGPWLVADEAAPAAYAGSAEVLTDAHAPVDQLVTQFS